MAYRWHYSTAQGGPVNGPQASFDDQTDAEDWLGSNWPRLLEDGVDQVTLLDGDTEVYGPMSLHPPESQ